MLPPHRLRPLKPQTQPCTQPFKTVANSDSFRYVARTSGAALSDCNSVPESNNRGALTCFML